MKRTVWMLWFGGSSYATPSIPEDLDCRMCLR